MYRNGNPDPSQQYPRTHSMKGYRALKLILKLGVAWGELDLFSYCISTWTKFPLLVMQNGEDGSGRLVSGLRCVLTRRVLVAVSRELSLDKSYPWLANYAVVAWQNLLAKGQLINFKKGCTTGCPTHVFMNFFFQQLNGFLISKQSVPDTTVTHRYFYHRFRPRGLTIHCSRRSSIPL